MGPITHDGGSMANVKALLFDLDGVLVDAMDWHEEAFLAALRSQGGVDLSTAEHRKAYAGLPTKEKLKRLVAAGRLDSRFTEKVAIAKQQFTMTYIEQRARPDRKRVYLLEHFQSAGFHLGCVTNCI